MKILLILAVITYTVLIRIVCSYELITHIENDELVLLMHSDIAYTIPWETYCILLDATLMISSVALGALAYLVILSINKVKWNF